MPTREFVLTDEERQEINDAYAAGVFDIPGEYDKFVQRVRNESQREGAITRALNESGFGARMGRDLRAMHIGFSAPDIGAEAAIQHYEDKGLIRGTGEIVWSAATTPIRSIAAVASGDLGENPLEPLVGVSSVLPVGLLASRAVSASLKGLAVRSLGSAATRRTLFANARQQAFNAARAAEASGASLDDALRAGVQAGHDIISQANPRAASLLDTAAAIHRVAAPGRLRNYARVAEVADVAAGIEEWPLEAIGEGAIDVGTSLLGVATNPLRDRLISDLTGGAQQQPPPVDITPPSDMGADVPPIPIAPSGDTKTPDTMPEEQQPPDTPPDTTTGTTTAVPPAFISELHQMPDGTPTTMGTSGATQTVDHTRKYSYGDPKDPDSIGVISVKHVPSPSGKFNNKNWEVSFEDGVLANQKITLTEDDGVNSYETARDLAFERATGQVEKETQEKTEQKDARDKRMEKYEPEPKPEPEPEQPAEPEPEQPAPVEQEHAEVQPEQTEEEPVIGSDRRDVDLEALENVFREAGSFMSNNPLATDADVIEFVESKLMDADGNIQRLEVNIVLVNLGIEGYDITGGEKQKLLERGAKYLKDVGIDIDISNTDRYTLSEVSTFATMVEEAQKLVDDGMDIIDAVTRVTSKYGIKDVTAINMSMIHPKWQKAGDSPRQARFLIEASIEEVITKQMETQEETQDESIDDTEAQVNKRQIREPAGEESTEPTGDEDTVRVGEGVEEGGTPSTEEGAPDETGFTGKPDEDISEEEKEVLREIETERSEGLRTLKGLKSMKSLSRAKPGGSYIHHEIIEGIIDTAANYAYAHPDFSLENIRDAESVEDAIELLLNRGKSIQAYHNSTIPDEEIELWRTFFNNNPLLVKDIQKSIKQEWIDESDQYDREYYEGLENQEQLPVETPEETPEEPEPAPTENLLIHRLKTKDYTTETNEQKLEDAIVHVLTRGHSITAEQLFEAASEIYGDKYNPQQIYDIMESAGNIYLSRQGLLDVNVDLDGALENIAKIQEIESRLPRQADRTAERIQNQQYSTPYHYAYLVNWVANLDANDTVLEPSAGTGNLAWSAKVLGATVHVNDIGKFRKKLLGNNFANVTDVDASAIDTRTSIKSTVVVMNPPFSSTTGKKKSQMLGVKMVESALKTLQPGGRLVAIVNGGRDFTAEMESGAEPGGGPNFNSKTYRKWWNRIAATHHIRANLHIDGNVYKGFGTTFNTRLLVIDKPLTNDNVDALRDSDGNLNESYDRMQRQHVETIAEAANLMESVRNERASSVEQPPSEPAGEEPVDETTQTQPIPDSEPEADTPAEQQDDRTGPGDVSAETTGLVSDDAAEPSGQPDERTEPPEQGEGTPGDDTEERVDLDAQPGEEPGESDGAEVSGDQRPGDRRVGGDRTPTDTPVRREDRGGGDDVSTQPTGDESSDITKTWVPAKESHIVKGRSVNLQETVSLANVESPNTDDIEILIPEEAKRLYSEAQLKVIALMIRAHESHIEPEILGDTPPRQGFYDGNDTGVGKTFDAAGIIAHNWAQGRRKHLVITATQNLVKDFKEAYAIAGGTGASKHIKDMPDNKTDIKGDGIIVTTYHTLAGQNMDSTRIRQLLEWVTGLKPPESMLDPRTDMELLHFGELPKTFAMTYTQHQAGTEFPEIVTDLISEFERVQRELSRTPSADNIEEHWNKEYMSIVNLSEQIRAAEGDVTVPEWTEKAKDFDGVIIFDESHKMKYSESSGGRKASATGIRGRQLQSLLPNARIAYMSATGTTAIENLAYMERLGLWGRNKPFADSTDFIAEMQQGGLASQEVVVRDLKAKGLFLSRSLDFSDVIVRSLVHPLSPDQEQAYNAMANAWQQIRLALFDYENRIRAEAADEEDNNADNLGAVLGTVWNNYYTKQQAFFGAMLDSMKMHSVIPDMVEQLDQGKKVILQIVNTYEQAQKRQVDRATEAGIDINDIEFSAREFLEDYLHEETGVFPTAAWERIEDADSGESMLRKARDKDGNVIQDAEMVAKRKELEQLVYSLFIPQSPLDQFVQLFKDRGLEIAEVTGRSKRYFRDDKGERVMEELTPKRKRADIKSFNDNKLFGLVFSKSGGTGANYPATDEKHPIVQYVIQVGWQADDFKQGLGRSKRSDEKAPPEIVMTSTDMVGERRFLATAAGRAAELGATTRSNAKEGTGLDLFDFDTKYIDSEFGRAALYNFLYDMYARSHTFAVPGEKNQQGGPLIIGWRESEDGSITSFREVTGLDPDLTRDVDLSEGDHRKQLPKVTQFLNRVLGAPSKAIQNALYYEFFDRLNVMLERAKAEGLLDAGVQTLQTSSAKIIDKKTIYTDPESGAKTYATDIEIQENTERLGWNHVENRFFMPDGTLKLGVYGFSFYINSEGRIFLDKPSGTTNVNGNVVENIRRESPSGSVRYMRRTSAYPPNEGTLHDISHDMDDNDIKAFLEEMRPVWEGEFETYPETQTNYVRMVEGLMSDVWDKINPPINMGQIVSFRDEERARQEIARRRLIRIKLDDGTDVIGRRFEEMSEYEAMLERFGQSTEDVAQYTVRIKADLPRIRDMIQENHTIETENGLTLKQRTSQGRSYISVEGDQNRLNSLVNDGILETFRPSGGRFVHELKTGNMGTFFSRHKPVASVKGNTRQEIEYEGGTDDTPSPPVTPSTPRTPVTPSEPEQEGLPEGLPSADEHVYTETEFIVKVERSGLDSDRGQDTEQQVQGYSVENTGIEYADFGVYQANAPNGKWVVVDIESGKVVGSMSANTKEESIRDAVWTAHDMGEEAYRKKLRKDTPEDTEESKKKARITRIRQIREENPGMSLKGAMQEYSKEQLQKRGGVVLSADDRAEIRKELTEPETPSQRTPAEPTPETPTEFSATDLGLELSINKDGDFQATIPSGSAFWDEWNKNKKRMKREGWVVSRAAEKWIATITPDELKDLYTDEIDEIDAIVAGRQQAIDEAKADIPKSLDDAFRIFNIKREQWNQFTPDQRLSAVEGLQNQADIKLEGEDGISSITEIEHARLTAAIDYLRDRVSENAVDFNTEGEENEKESTEETPEESPDTPERTPEPTEESGEVGEEGAARTTEEKTPVEETPVETPEISEDASDIIKQEYEFYKQRIDELGDDSIDKVLSTNTGLQISQRIKYYMVDRGYGEEQSDIIFRVNHVDKTDTSTDWEITVQKRDGTKRTTIHQSIVGRSGGIRPKQRVIKDARDALLKFFMEQTGERVATKPVDAVTKPRQTTPKTPAEPTTPETVVEYADPRTDAAGFVAWLKGRDLEHLGRSRQGVAGMDLGGDGDVISVGEDIQLTVRRDVNNRDKFNVRIDMPSRPGSYVNDLIYTESFDLPLPVGKTLESHSLQIVKMLIDGLTLEKFQASFDKYNRPTPETPAEPETDDITYQGATFIEVPPGGTIKHTRYTIEEKADNIPDSFWDYFYENREAMREGGWSQTHHDFHSGRHYTFIISKSDFEKWKAAHPDTTSPEVAKHLRNLRISPAAWLESTWTDEREGNNEDRLRVLNSAINEQRRLYIDDGVEAQEESYKVLSDPLRDEEPTPELEVPTKAQIDAWDKDPNIYYRIDTKGRTAKGQMGESQPIEEAFNEALDEAISRLGNDKYQNIKQEIDDLGFDFGVTKGKWGAIQKGVLDILPDELETLTKEIATEKLKEKGIEFDDEFGYWTINETYALKTLDELARYVLPRDGKPKMFSEGENIVDATKNHDKVIQVLKSDNAKTPPGQTDTIEVILDSPEIIHEMPADVLLNLETDIRTGDYVFNEGYKTRKGTWGESLGLKNYTKLSEETSDFTYQGATFTEEGNTLVIVGDQIPESFWTYWHSGGRGRNSAHKKAMKDAGWKYSWRGSGSSREYVFSISKTDLEKWKAAHPDDGSAPKEYVESGTPEQMAMITALREVEPETVPATYNAIGEEITGRSYKLGQGVTASVRHFGLKKQYDVGIGRTSHEDTQNLNIPYQTIHFREVGANDSNYNTEEIERAALKLALEKIDASELEFSDQPPTYQEREAQQAPLREKYKAGLLQELEAGNYVAEGSTYTATVDGTEVEFRIMRSSVTSLFGQTEPERHTQIYISPKNTTAGVEPPFTTFTISVPNEIVDKYNNLFIETDLAAMQDAANWERDGRKNAFLYKDGGSVAIKKDYNRYEARFSFDAGSPSMYRVAGDTLQERLESALSGLSPHDFKHHEIEMIIDTLNEGETDINTHLQALGINPADWEILTPEEKTQVISERYEALQIREINEDDYEVPDEAKRAVNALIGVTDTNLLSDVDWRHAFPPNKTERSKVNAEYSAQTELIIENSEEDVQVQLKRLNRKLRSGDYFGLRGRKIRHAEEAALIAQFIRNPTVESTLTLLRRNNKIVQAEFVSIGKMNNTAAPLTNRLKDWLEAHNADDFIIIHNHPSGNARFSNNDKYITQKLRDDFGSDFAEMIIINNGKFARANFDGEDISYENYISLDLKGDTTTQPELFGAFYRTPDNWTTLLLLDEMGNTVSVMETHGLWGMPVSGIVSKLQTLLESVPDATNMHIVVGRGHSRQEGNKMSQVMREIANNVESAWVEGRPLPDFVSRVGNLSPKVIYKNQLSDVSGGSTLVYTLETIRDVPDLPEPKLTKQRTYKLLAGTRLREKIDGLTPKMKYSIEASRRAYQAGMTNLRNLGPVGRAILDAAEYSLDTMDRGSAVDLSLIRPPLAEFDNLVKQRTERVEEKGVVRADMSKLVWNFVEYGTPIDDDPELQAVAESFKEAWREVLLNETMAMLQLRREVESLDGDEQVAIRNSSGKISRDWTPIVTGYGNEVRYDNGVPMIQRWYTEKGTNVKDKDIWVSVEEAIRTSNKLYLPHRYSRAHWDGIVRMVETNNVIGKLEAAAKRKGTKIIGFKYDEATSTWTFDRTDDTFTDKQSAVDFAIDYWKRQVSIAREKIDADRSALLGRYGHLELERETTDKLYERDITMLPDHIEMTWRRIGEIAVWGQYDPVTGRWPRLAKYIARIGNTPLSQREAAVNTISEILLGSASDMFERLPDFSQGTKTAQNIVADWNTIDIQKMIDENPDKMTDAVIKTLVDIGMIRKADNNNYELVGKSREAKMTTFIKHMVPHWMIINLREKTVTNIIRGIGNWATPDELNSHVNKVLTTINHLTTAMTLGPRTSIQNIAEIPLLAAMSGSKNMTAGISRVAVDKDFRAMLPNVGATYTRATAFYMDTALQSQYLKYIGFTATEEASRLVGVAVGWETAIDAIRKYIANQSAANRQRLEELRISVEPIDNYRQMVATGQAPPLEDLVKEAEQRVRDGDMSINGLVRPNASAPSNKHVDWVGNEIAAAARYLSISILKPYNPLTLPQFLTRSDPLVRILFKFMAWPAQMHRFMWDEFRKAKDEGKKGNFGPAWRIAQGFSYMGLSGSALGAFFLWVSGYDDDDSGNFLMAGIAEAHVLGLGSMLLQMSMYSDGNPYRAAKLIESALGSPTAGVIARMGGNLVAGRPKAAAGDIFWQLPGFRDVRRFGGFAVQNEEE